MPSPRKKKEKPPPGPDDLVRESAGAYRTGDGRFEVQKADLGWYLVDTAQTNEFGQQLIHGPLATLDAVRGAIPGARLIKPLLRHSSKKQNRPTVHDEPPPPPPSWIDQLPEREAADVSRLIRALEKEGLSDADELVKRHRDDAVPVIATRVVEHRLKSLIEGEPAEDREYATALVRRVIDAVAVEGMSTAPPLPRWALMEVRGEDDRTTTRIKPRV